MPLTQKISCIICAYNEAERIQNILAAVANHPLLREVIVVNDGSTDEIGELLSHYPNIRVISYAPNRGKTYALSLGIQAATGEYLMLLDADLSGVEKDDITALAEPVLSGVAGVSISLRRNSLLLYRIIGLDFVSGERVIPRTLFTHAEQEMQHLPRWGAEAFINRRIIMKKIPLAVVRWERVYNVRKYQKVGMLRGVAAEFGMISDALRVLSLPGIVSQNISLLALKRASRKARSRSTTTAQG